LNQPWSRLLAAAVLAAAAGCSTVGVARGEGGYAVVRPTVAHEMMLDSQQVVVFDLRPLTEFEGPLGHIEGAIPVPITSIEPRLPDLLAYRDTTVLVYGDNEEESRRGARILAESGFKNIVRIEGGIRSWIELGYATVVSGR
jgi:rhodanese-related sulfurtransferase